jgi:subtilase family serine protease
MNLTIHCHQTSQRSVLADKATTFGLNPTLGNDEFSFTIVSGAVKQSEFLDLPEFKSGDAVVFGLETTKSPLGCYSNHVLSDSTTHGRLRFQKKKTETTNDDQIKQPQTSHEIYMYQRKLNKIANREDREFNRHLSQWNHRTQTQTQTQTVSAKANKTKSVSIPRAVSYGRTATSLGTYYNFPPQQGTTKPVIAIISLGGTYLTADLNYYWRTVCGLTVVPTVSYVAVDGVPNRPNQKIVSGDGSDENTLDIEIAGALCPTANIIVYFGVNSFQGFYNVISAAINDTVNKPNIISISWGAPEVYFSTAQLNAYNALFASAIAKKITITAASGDNGSDDGVGDGKVHCDFPCSSPNVVACGGTSLKTATESVWSWTKLSQCGTGGGLSSLFLQPAYQTGVVTYPTATVTALKGKRGVPDLALNGDPASGWTIYFNGKLNVSAFGGTSCVAPAMAGLLGLMNLVYPVSFNDSVYKLASNRTCFKDIISGTNSSTKDMKSYVATTGYDFCSGLGSLNGVNLLAQLALTSQRR